MLTDFCPLTSARVAPMFPAQIVHAIQLLFLRHAFMILVAECDSKYFVFISQNAFGA